MPITVPDPPEDSVESAIHGLKSIVGIAAIPSVREVLGGAQPDLSVTAPHAVFVLGLDELRERVQHNYTSPDAWEYLVADGGSIIAAAETAGEQHEFVFTQLDQGWMPNAIEEGIRVAETEVGDQTLELRVIRVPALNSTSIWLHGDDDFLMPIAAPPSGFDSYKLYPFEDVMAALTAAAVDLEDDGLKGG